MLLEAIAHWETSLNGMELIPILDLHRNQRHQYATMDAMKGDLLDTGQDVMEAGVDEGALGVDGHHSRIRC